MQKYVYTALVFCGFALCGSAQPLSFNFHRVTTAHGLNVSGTTAISEDKYGYIWFGTVNGLNRYDGYGMKVYEHRFGDTTSLMPSAVRFMFCDAQGRLWISFMNGLMEYDYEHDAFRNCNLGDATWVTQIVEAKQGLLYIATSNGLAKFNTSNDQVTWFDSLNTVGRGWPSQVGDIATYHDTLYLTTRNGITVFDLQNESHYNIALPPYVNPIGRIAITASGDVWLGGKEDGDPVWRTNTKFNVWKKYPDLEVSPSGQVNRVNHLFADLQGRLWATSAWGGIALYDPYIDKFRYANIEPWMPNGVLTAYLGRIYQDRKGQIWAESTKGAAYFNPNQNFFKTIIPANNANADEGQLACNGVAETPNGLLWIATSNGLYQLDPITGQYRCYKNETGKKPQLHHNIVHGVYLSPNGDLWISTRKGINLIRAGHTETEFLGEREGLPYVFSLDILQSKDGTLWVANFSDPGHQYRPPGATKFKPISEHPDLGTYAGRYGHCILEDSKGRLWFGLDGLGLLFYDPQTKKVRHWQRTPQNDTTLAGNYVNSLSESPDGTIWAATSMGLSGIDPQSFRFKNYDRSRGLPTNRVVNVMADAYNRLWLGTAQGLLLMDSTRQHIRQFDLMDGLPDTEFSPFPVRQLSQNRFVFPSKRGLVVFRPTNYKSQQESLPLWLSGVRVFNQPFSTPTNPEQLEALYLPPSKNFFSLDIVALNYANPRQTWYAYKMEPYDKDWVVSRNPVANYTNVPSGQYVFRYKATSDPNNWDSPEKQLRICVGEQWYRSNWFWGTLLFLAVGAGAIAFGRRSRLQQAVFDLERKAQALAKEKALVQYENLTQQLNPHFLFNSLASLGSLIRFDPKKASEFLEALSKMYRYILQSRDRETVPIREEATFAEQFLKLQKTRFGAALQVRFHIDPALSERKIVPVTLQNLLENAMKHNTFDTDDPLVVDIFTENNCLVVRNNLQRRPIVETSNKQGLARLQSLYQYLSDTPMTIHEDGQFFTVKLPLLP